MKFLTIASIIPTLFALEAVSNLVTEFTPDTFASLVDGADHPWLVKFYAPWCGHCKALAPVFEDVANVLEKDDHKAKLGKVDCTAHKSICTRFGVDGFPTIKFIENANVREFSGTRTKDSLLRYIRKMSEDSILDAASVESALKLARDNASSDFAPSFVLCAPENVSLPPVVYSTAENLKDKITFVLARSENCESELKTSERVSPSVRISVVSRIKDLPVVPLTEEHVSSEESLSKWLYAHARQPITRVAHWNFSTLNSQPQPLILVAIDRKGETPIEGHSKEEAVKVNSVAYVTSQLKALSEARRLDFAFGYIDLQEIGESAAEFGLDVKRGFPQVTILTPRFKGLFVHESVGRLEDLPVALSLIDSGELQAAKVGENKLAKVAEEVFKFFTATPTRKFLGISIVCMYIFGIVAMFAWCCLSPASKHEVPFKQQQDKLDELARAKRNEGPQGKAPADERVSEEVRQRK